MNRTEQTERRLAATRPSRRAGAIPQLWDAWPDRACAGEPTEVFFPAQGESAAAAKAICADCPRRSDCLDHAIRYGEHYGIWGGLNERERTQVRRRRPRTRSSQ